MPRADAQCAGTGPSGGRPRWGPRFGKCVEYRYREVGWFEGDNFWATWCLECRVELPALEQLHRDYASRGLTVLAVNFREAPGTVQRYARELSLTMPLLVDPAGAITKSYGVIGLPTSFLIGRDGRAVARAIGPREWATAEARALIESLLTEPPGRR